MRWRLIVLAGLLGVALAVASLAAATARPPAGQGTPVAGTPAATPGGTPDASPVAGGQVTVKIIDTSFVPGTITIPTGTTVTWINEDRIPHTATGAHNEFDSSILDQGDRYSYTFTKPGTYAYFCKLHPDMLGRVIVVTPGG